MSDPLVINGTLTKVLIWHILNVYGVRAFTLGLANAICWYV